MDPVEINAGSWYLRALRADALMDDRPGLAAMGEHAAGHVADSHAAWSEDRRFTWAVCEPTTGELLAEVVLHPADGAVTTRARSGHDDAAAAAADAVGRFAESALGLRS